MSPALSAYLDFVRLATAFLVFAHHASYPRFGGSWISALGGYGHESVVVFFVLSGFVIAYSREHKDPTLKHFVANRFSRLWSVALPAIILTLLMDAVGRSLSPDQYVGICESTFIEIVGAIFFFNELWWLAGCVGSNIPFWSLSYEFFYYFIFAVYSFSSCKWIFSFFAALLVGPKLLLLLPSWIAGVIAYNLTKKNLSRQVGLLLAIVGIELFITIAYFKIGNKFITWRLTELIGPLWTNRLGHSTAFISDNLLGVLFAAHLLGMHNLLKTIAINHATRSTVNKISSSTFAIYLMHYPALIFFTSVNLYVNGAVNGIFVGVSSIAVPMIMTKYTELLKRILRQLFIASR